MINDEVHEFIYLLILENIVTVSSYFSFSAQHFRHQATFYIQRQEAMSKFTPEALPDLTGYVTIVTGGHSGL